MGSAGDGRVKQTLGSEARVLGKYTLVGDLLFVVQKVIFHGGGEGTHLEGGAGGIVSAEGPVKEGLQGVRLNGVPVLVHGSQIVAGVAGAGQNLAGLDFHDDDRGAFRVQTQAALFGVDLRVGNLGHDLCQGVLRNHLQRQVNGGFQVVAGDGVFLIVLLDDGAVSGNHVHADSVDAVEVFFKSLLKARLTDVGVHGVVLVFIDFPVIGVHTAHVAQDMGGVLGVVFPDGGGFDHQTRGIQLQDGAEVLVGNVFHEGVGGQIGNAAKVKFVAHTHHGPGLFVGPGFRDVIAFPELFQQQRGGNIRVQLPVAHIVLEVVLPGGGVVVEGVLEGAGLGHGEMVQIFHAQLQGLVVKPVEVIVTSLGGFDNVVVKHQVITGPVTHQHIAVAVQDIAPGGTDGGNGGIDGGVVRVAIGLDDLQGEELTGKHGKHQAEQEQQSNGADAAYSFHVCPPILPNLCMRGNRGIIMTQL